MWTGKVDIVGDIMADTSDLWEVLRENRASLCCLVSCWIRMSPFAG